jgi:hypothetical protein
MSDPLTQPRALGLRADLPYLAALALLIGALYLPQFFTGRTAMERPEKMDVTSQWYPGYLMTGRAYQQGTFPLWNSIPYGGMPWVAYSHAGCLYPPNIFLFSVFNFFDAVTLAHLLHGLLAAIGMYLLARALGLSPAAAFAAGLVFPCTGFFYYLQSQLSNHATIAWYPLFLLGLTRLARRAGLPALVGTGLTVMMMVLAGDTEGFTYGVICAGLFLGLYLRRKAAGGPVRLVMAAGGALALGLMISAAMTLCLVELLGYSVRSARALIPVEFSGAFQAWYLYLPYLLLPLRSFSALHPNSDFNSGLAPFYFGALPLAGALAGLYAYRRDRRMRALGLVAGLMLALMIVKKIAFFAPALKLIPVFGQLATPERSLEFVQLLLILIAAMALDRIRRAASRRAIMILGAAFIGWGGVTLAGAPRMVAPEARYLFGALLALAGAGMLAVERRHRLAPAAVGAAALALAVVDVYGLALAAVPRVRPADYALDPAARAFLDKQDPDYRFMSFQRIDPSENDALISGLVSAETGLDSPFGHMRLPLARWFEFLHVINPEVARDWSKVFFGAPSGKKLFYTVDLNQPGFLDNHNLHLLNLLAVRYVLARDLSFQYASPFSLMSKEGVVAGEWPSSAGRPDFKRARDGRRWLKVALPFHFEFESYIYPGMELAFEVEPSEEVTIDLTADLTACPKEGADACKLWSVPVKLAGRSALAVRIPLDAASGRNNRFTLLVGGQAVADSRAPREVRIIDARLIRPDAPFQRVAAGPLDIYVNTRALPRALVIHEARVVSTAELPELMRAADRFDPGRMVWFETGAVPDKLIALAAAAPALGREPVKILTRTHDAVQLAGGLNTPGWLVLADAYHPGWRAWVDGAETKIYRADYALRALFLTEGRHEIVFRYEPACFRIGLGLALGSLLSVLGALAASWAGRVRL